MRMLIAGANGLIGCELVQYFVNKGWDVMRLSRKAGPLTIVWDPVTGSLSSQEIECFDVIINLCGESIRGRWSQSKKKAILDSRIQATSLLVKTIRTLKRPPAVYMNASAIGFYGSRGDTIIDETDSAGSGFLSNVCVQWESEARKLTSDGIRVVLLRFGVVLSKKGGALSALLLPFKCCLGGHIGAGRQYMSWISLKDIPPIVDFIFKTEKLQGPVNVVAPCPVTNNTFTKVLGKSLKRPACLPLPAWLIKLVLGESADELLLCSQRVHPSKLQKAGYSYVDPHLEVVLKRNKS